MSPSPQNPGSPEAHLRGCKCSRAKNRDGNGAGQNGRGELLFIVEKRCPLHGDEKYRKAEP